MLYSLILTDPECSYDNYSEDFFIGVYETKKQAEETGLFYLENVKGFSQFPCTYHIVEKEIIDNYDHIMPDYVWMVWGWNCNEYLDEIDIVESSFFLTEERAESELQLMKKQYQRTEWVVSRYKIGESGWRDGFARLENGEFVNN
ncbi:MAG: hypothetical protein K2K70_02465 [Lachnospiraceae bacterium]|nr:hypothetical protein [Lachnospiraceae bacterium]